MSKKDFSAKALAALLAKGKPEEAEAIIEKFLAEAIAEALNESVETSKTEIERLISERDAALLSVQEMSEQIALQSEIKDANTMVVSIEGEKFKLQGGNFTVPGHGKLSLAELAVNEAALIVMRDRQSGALTKFDK